MSSILDDTRQAPPDLALTNCAVLGNAGVPILQIPSFELNRGDQVAIVGANGAGKTMLLEVMLGLRRPVGTEPSVSPDRVFGVPSMELGVQLQAGGFNGWYTVAEVVRLHSLNYPNICSNIRESLGIDQLAERKMGQLSRGQRQRVELYVALAHKPRVIVLDEPTTGLDARRIESLLDILSELSEQEDRTIVMACHTVTECELMSKICQIVGGRIKRFGRREALITELLGQAEITYSFNNEGDLHLAADWTGSREGVKNVRLRPEALSLTVAHSFNVGSPELEQLLSDARKQFQVVSFGVAPASTKSLITHLIEDTYA